MGNRFNIYYSPEKILLEKWEAILSDTKGSFFQSPKAYQFYRAAGLDCFFIALEIDGRLKCLTVGIIQKDGGLLKSFFSRRAIIYGGPLLIDGINKAELTGFFKALKSHLKNRAIYIESRNLNDYSNHINSIQDNGFTFIPHLNFKIDCSDENLVKKNISKSKLRQINKSLKSGAEIVEAATIEEVKDFYKILRTLYSSKIKIPLFPEKFFIEFFNQKIGKYLLIKWNSKIIGGIMCPIFDKKVVYEWFVCDDGRKYNGIYPSVLATWAGINYAISNEIRYFDFLGAGAPGKDYGVRDFKAKFGGELFEYGRFIYICKPFLYQFGKLGLKITKLIN